MQNMVDFEKVHKIFLQQGHQITGKLNAAIEQKGLTRLDETARELLSSLENWYSKRCFYKSATR